MAADHVKFGSEGNPVEPMPAGNSIIDKLLGFPTVFANVRVYGTEEDPLFFCKDVAEAIGKSSNYRRTVAAMSSPPGWFTQKTWVNLIKKRDEKVYTAVTEVTMLTEAGLYKFIGKYDGELSNQFSMFIAKIMKGLRLEGEITLKKAQDELRKELHLLHKEKESLQAQVINYEYANAELADLQRVMKEADELVLHDRTAIRAHYYDELHADKLYVYAVNPKNAVPRKPKKEDWDSDASDGEIYVEDYAEDFDISRADMYDPELTYYYSVFATQKVNPKDKKYRIVGSVFVGKKGLNVLKKTLEPCQTRSGIYATTLANIQNEAAKILNDSIAGQAEAKTQEAKKKYEARCEAAKAS